jgi:Fe-S cluster biosynthesis and repair protein YggX
VSGTVECRRCGRAQAPALAKPPLRGPLGEEIASRVCADCWAEWERAEVMVINELQLNFMDPKAQEVLHRHLREFLFLDDGEEGPGNRSGS